MVSGDRDAAAAGLPLVVARCICKHVLQPVGLSQEEAHLLVTPVDGGEVLQQHQQALSSNTTTSSQLQQKPTKRCFHKCNEAESFRAQHSHEQRYLKITHGEDLLAPLQEESSTDVQVEL